MTIGLNDIFDEIEILDAYANYPMARISSVGSEYKMRIRFEDTPGCIILNKSERTLKQKVYKKTMNEDFLVDFVINKNAKLFVEEELDVKDINVTIKEEITKEELNDAIHLLTIYISREHRNNSRNLRSIQIEQ